jgi:hypothetical protein
MSRVAYFYLDIFIAAPRRFLTSILNQEIMT